MPYRYTHEQTFNLLRIVQEHFLKFEKLIFRSPANKTALDALSDHCLTIQWPNQDEPNQNKKLNGLELIDHVLRLPINYPN